MGADEVATYRAVRLRALSVDPGAFRSTLEQESASSDEVWRARLAGFNGGPGVVVIDEVEDEVRGMVGVGLAAERGVAVLWGMWVAPEARGQGSGRALLGAALDAARSLGATTVELEVVDGNDEATHMYERAGFVDVGAGDVAGERRMRR